MSEKCKGAMRDAGLLLLRLSAAGMMIYAHGWGKYVRWPELSSKFMDFLGVGSATSLALAIFAEVVCAAAVGAGLFTRLAAVPVAVTMFVAAFVAHAGDPFARREMSLLYLVIFVVVALTGPGRYSLDAVLGRMRGRRGAAAAELAGS